MTKTKPKTTGYIIAEKQPFAQSLLWEWQQHYFANMGVEAWRQSEVPHYVTSNPTMANSYAEIVFALWRDQQRPGQPDKASDEPLYVSELGAGSGRFAFHFLKRLTHLCHQAALSPVSFCYILTDVAESNLDFLHRHPRFQAYFESGLLDLAHFDVNQSSQLHLRLRDQTITPASLNRPLVAIANYLFDSIPQDLFYINDDRCYQGLMSLMTPEDPTTLSLEQTLANMHYTYHYRELTEPPYPEAYLQQLISTYQGTLSDTHLLFPVVGLRCLQRLRALSKLGMLLLSADKGQHRLSALQGRKPPRLMVHGACISLSVNYHALKAFCEQSGGMALFPDYHHRRLIVSTLLLLNEAGSYTETQRAYQRHVQEFSPEEFHTITIHARKSIPEMSVEEILAYVRLSLYDSHQFAHYLPHLTELAPQLNSKERRNLSDAVDKVWDLYFPLGEEVDLAHQIACLLYEMDDYALALTYFERSTEIYGEYIGTLYNMAVCYQFLEQHEQAESLLCKVLKYEPDNHQAKSLLAAYKFGNDSDPETPFSPKTPLPLLPK